MIINDLILPEKPSLILSEKNKSVFEIKPLYPGYGVTIGNALRRVLLSSLEGAAITKVKIQDVLHEFSTLPGVQEDILDIILSLKKIRFKLDVASSIELHLSVSGKKEVTAKDIQQVSGVNIINLDHHIATLTDNKAKLDMTITVEKGRGYSPAEERTKDRLVAGEIVLDAIFSPVINAVYEVENIRYQDRIDYNLLRLTIETDGTITPEEAFSNSVKILINQFNSLINEN